jgi:hypothetical protein
MQFTQFWVDQGLEVADARNMLVAFGMPGSDDRFSALLSWMTDRQSDVVKTKQPAAKAQKSKKVPIGEPKQRIGSVVHTGDRIRLEFSPKQARGFDKWLAENINSIHRQFLKETSGE